MSENSTESGKEGGLEIQSGVVKGVMGVSYSCIYGLMSKIGVLSEIYGVWPHFSFICLNLSGAVCRASISYLLCAINISYNNNNL